jgi:hypothetical protein
MPARGKILLFFCLAFLFFFSLFFLPSFSWAMELVLSQVPTEAAVGQEFEVYFYYQTTVKEGKYYLRPCFYLEGATSYFGCIKNNQADWACGSQADKTAYFEIETDNQGIWEGSLVIKADGGEGDYQLKIKRYTVGGSDEDSNSLPIKILALTPSLTPSSEPATTPSPAPAFSPTKATYQINEVKDEVGTIVPNAKVYLDDEYLHHYAPEILTFCEDCQCDSFVSCGFGEHNFKLVKSGYQDWSETRTISPGDYYQVDPIMEPEEEDSGSSPTSTPASSPTPSLVPTKTPTPTPETEDLIESESTEEAFFNFREEENQSAEKDQKGEVLGKSAKGRKDFLSLVLIGGGMIFISLAWGFWKTGQLPILAGLKRRRQNRALDKKVEIEL